MISSYAQSPPISTNYYDSVGRVTKSIDSVGNEVDYTYDSVGNITQITRGTAPAANTVAILNFIPQSGSVTIPVTILGQNFSTTPSANTVTFNGTPATVSAATATTLTVAVPPGATTGPISVTVAGQTATSSSNFVVNTNPVVLSVSPAYFLTATTTTTVPNFKVTGYNLAGSTFSFAPAFVPAPISVTSVTISPDGTSATLSLSVAANTLGSFALIASNAGGASSVIPTTAKTIQSISPDGDADGDGLTNAVEIALGTSPLNPTTSGVGLPDGWQVFYGLNPLSAASAGPDPAGSGNTALQDFQQGLSPRSATRTAPTVTQVVPANGSTNVAINSRIALRFSTPLQGGTSLASAQSAIAAALGTNTTVSSSSQAIAATTLQSYMNRTCCGNSVTPTIATLSGPYGAVPGTATASTDGYSVTFTPAQPLQSNTAFTIQALGAKDTAGNMMKTPYSSTFTTGSSLDQTSLTFISSVPTNGASSVSATATVAATFNGAVDPATLTTTSFAVKDLTGEAAVAGTYGVNASGSTAIFTPGQPLPLNHFFSVTLTNGIQDLSGNALIATYSYGFTTTAITQEFDTASFALLNGISPAPTSATLREFDTLSFSLLNGDKPVQAPTYPAEFNTPTFSILNGTAPANGVIVHEVDSVTFSVHNTHP